ncbi:MAG: 16S rRNA (cytidine(1402)-2'-O)-methyltransferase [Thiovulaceae bacterium]|nr:16S rRNA (cytidine(1402)-2'-O)-methyltransferase [Sulfurimonadaceae bacterium]
MLTLVPTPIGNLEDISKRSLNALFEASTILCEDTRVTKKLLTLLSERNSLPPSSAKLIAIHSHNEREFLDKNPKTFFDDNVVYVSDAGMPGISDPGQFLVNYCLEKALPYEVLPGASASLLAFVASGFINTEFLFAAFLAHKGSARSTKLDELLYSGYTVVLYESPHRLLKLLQELNDKEPHRRIYLAKEISKKFETRYRDESSVLYEILKNENIRGEWVVVIEAGEKQNLLTLSQADVLKLKLPLKDKAKLLASFTQDSSKSWYQKLLNEDFN